MRKFYECLLSNLTMYKLVHFSPINIYTLCSLLLFFLKMVRSPLLTDLTAFISSSNLLSKFSTKWTRLCFLFGDILLFPLFAMKFIFWLVSSSLNKTFVMVRKKFPAEYASILAFCWIALLKTNSHSPRTISLGEFTSCSQWSISTIILLTTLKSTCKQLSMGRSTGTILMGWVNSNNLSWIFPRRVFRGRLFNYILFIKSLDKQFIWK